MKRSEAIELVRLTLKLSGNVYCDDDRDKDLAEQVMDLIEHNIGMKPPGYTEDPECIGSYMEDEWEPEDETN